MKKADFITNILMLPIDFGLVILAALSAYLFRFSQSIAEIRPIVYELPLSEYFYLVLQVAVLAIIIFALSGFYTIRSRKLANELPKIITGISLTVFVLVLVIFLQRELFSSRFIIVLAWALAIVYLFIARIVVYTIRNYFLRHGYGLANIIVLGTPDSRALISGEYKNNTRLGFRPVAEYDSLANLIADLMDNNWLKDRRIDSIIQSDSNLSKEEALDILTFCQENHLSLSYVANLFQTQSLHTNLSSVAGLPIVEIKGTPLEGWRRVLKRIFDLVLAVLFLIVLSPLFLLLAIIIKASSAGPVIVSLTRVGAKGKSFRLYKFRSMIKDAHQLKSQMMTANERADGPLFKIKDDPRITAVGKWLRRSSLDELPQLFNVLMGQMSLVGPRPHEPEEVSRYERGYRKLLTIKPGITGMAQVSGRSHLLFSEEAKLDIFYIENWSILLDLIIILKTIKVVLSKDQAY